MKARVLVMLVVLFGLTARSQQLVDSLPQELLNFFPGWDSAQLEAQLQPVPPQEVPKSGTFWHIPLPGQQQMPPYPCPPEDRLVLSVANSSVFLVDDSVVLSGGKKVQRLTSQPPPPGGGGYGTNPPPVPQIDTRRNLVKFANQAFGVLNTNDVNPTLYALCRSFPASPTGPNLQIKNYGANAVVIRANHFDYSNESRDFALLVNDNVGAPVWKTVDLLGSSDSQDGWLIQGIVNRQSVVDPMYLIVTNLASPAEFFRAIPYAGPVVTLTGPTANSTVNGSITLHAAVSDLSGTSNELTSVVVNGLNARYALSAGNTITLDTRYSINGLDTICVKVANYNAVATAPSVAPLDMPNTFETKSTLPLDFENSTYVYFQSDNASPDVLTNFIQFGVVPPVSISAKITEPKSGRVLASFGGTDPSSPVVQLNWNFTEANGTAYTNDTYAVSFTANSTTLTVTNQISRAGVRPANWVVNNYEEIGSHEPGGSNAGFINSEMARWFGAMESMYENLYSSDFASQSQYFSWQIGNGRDNPKNIFPFNLNPNTELGWVPFIKGCITNIQYSDFNWQGHGNQAWIGGGPWPTGLGYLNNVNTKISGDDMYGWVTANAKTAPGRRYRMRKVGMWSCRSARISHELAVGSWWLAFGIYLPDNEINALMWKNAGIFFDDDLYFAPPKTGGYGSPVPTDVEEVLATFDKYFVMGANPYPGGANPNYSIQFALNVTLGTFPELSGAKPVLAGYPWLPYAGVYDDQLRNLDKHQVVQ